ncbi:hypothetical protein JTE90_023475 [Oedothorax gibbosus]|uniref:Uncharacterized protein n=1 Tax=Oedothorax gibbosus TaxID=931172 RepID=A0AAV6VR54_9ARAC|nr:hypothetical protein JTE90_023475 [Oedothorax gibbosus]
MIEYQLHSLAISDVPAADVPANSRASAADVSPTPEPKCQLSSIPLQSRADEPLNSSAYLYWCPASRICQTTPPLSSQVSPSGSLLFPSKQQIPL